MAPIHSLPTPSLLSSPTSFTFSSPSPAPSYSSSSPGSGVAVPLAVSLFVLRYHPEDQVSRQQREKVSVLEEVPGVPLQGLRGVVWGRVDEAGVDVGLQRERRGGHQGSFIQLIF